jgi:flagellar motor switch protein FliM
MDKPLLDMQELEAIRSAISTGTMAAASMPDQPNAVPIAIIVDDRAAESARPSGLKIAMRWITTARRRVVRLTGVKLDLQVTGAETVDVGSFREDLVSSWTGFVGLKDRDGLGMVVASGSMIESFAARLLGASADDMVPVDRPPSATAMRVFSPVGEALVGALAEAWSQEQRCPVDVIADNSKGETWRRGLNDTDLVVVVTIMVSGAASGSIRLIARPETLVVPPVPVEAIAPPPGAIDKALGGVPIEVLVELGRVRMSMGEFKDLQPGTVLVLHQFIDDLIPVRCAGIVKAFGKALVSRGVMSVRIEKNPLHDGSGAL